MTFFQIFLFNYDSREYKIPDASHFDEFPSKIIEMVSFIGNNIRVDVLIIIGFQLNFILVIFPSAVLFVQ